ncbi:Germin-like protein 8-2 [Acorus gramineus]|uniref:Germin-like protein 8-2 n=1 Tax=Acorus gramineus TaxID=55184 RepID=A0AAV9BMZ2_ACOGR|nr:Germin-like protein 8-2 [Acorus gramineus]
MASTISMVVVLLALAYSGALASDPSPLQDFCVADKASPVLVNGLVCKNPMNVTAEDFFFCGLNKPGNTNNKQGSNVTAVNVMQIPGLNTLGVSLARIDFAPYGLNPPHTHPRATEILTVIEGTLHGSFTSSSTPDMHADAVAITGLSSQNPGLITIGNAVFGSDPKIDGGVLAKAFQVDKGLIDYLQKQFWMDNSN